MFFFQIHLYKSGVYNFFRIKWFFVGSYMMSGNSELRILKILIKKIKILLFVNQFLKNVYFKEDT